MTHFGFAQNYLYMQNMKYECCTNKTIEVTLTATIHPLKIILKMTTEVTFCWV